MDDVQDVEQLAFVLVDALDLDIEHGVRVEDHAAFGLHQGCQPLLVVLLDLRATAPGSPDRRHRGDQLAHLLQVGDPARRRWSR